MAYSPFSSGACLCDKVLYPNDLAVNSSDRNPSIVKSRVTVDVYILSKEKLHLF